MNPKAAVIFYSLVSFVIATAIFVLQPTGIPEMHSLQMEVTQSFSIAWQQTMGDQPYFSDLAQVYNGTTAFYDQSATSMIAMFQDNTGTDQDLAQVFGQVYHDFADASSILGKNSTVASATTMGDKFMSQNPIYNLVPADQSLRTSGQVLGAETSAAELPAGPSVDSPWFTATDGMTGQKYCIAVFDGNINKYLGSCQNEYH